MKAEERLKNALDMQNIIRNQRAFKTLIELLLSRPSRKLLYYQRKQIVIDLKDENKANQSKSYSDSSSSNEYSTKKIKKVLKKVISKPNEYDYHTNIFYKGVLERNVTPQVPMIE